jgi:hypothetical protein
MGVWAETQFWLELLLSFPGPEPEPEGPPHWSQPYFDRDLPNALEFGP